jgi:hypothetical protein
MRRSPTLALVILLVSCGGSSPGTGTTAASSPPEAPIACGATVRDTGGHRCATDGEACAVLDGSCACRATLTYTPHCGGASYRAEPIVGPLAWECTPRDATADRGDGCPFSPPLDGTMCPRPELACSYGEPDGCGTFVGAVARCVGGHWAVRVTMPVPYQ